MFEERLVELLRQLLSQTDAKELRIARASGVQGDRQCSSKLGKGAYLVAHFDGPEEAMRIPSRRERLERAARALRELQRECDMQPWPELAFPDAAEAVKEPRRLVLARIQQFLQALVDSSPMHQQVLALRGQLIASAGPLDAYEEAQLELLYRQLDRANDDAVGTAHGELVRPGLYAHSFWYGAALIGFSRGEYSADFMRHRCRIVARELVGLLEMLDGGPESPAKEAPPP